MDRVELEAALCHHISRDGRVDAAAYQHGGETRCAYGHTALTAYSAAADIGSEIADFNGDRYIRLPDVYLEVRTGREQLAADLSRYLGAFVWEALVGAL